MNAQPIQQPQLTFAPELVWQQIETLLKSQLGPKVDVDTIGAKDFDEDGKLAVMPPAVRVFFAGEEATVFDSQAQNYSIDQKFGVVCAEEDLSDDPQVQRLKSITLSSRVKSILIGARLLLDTGETTEPIAYAGLDMLPTSSVGMAYVAGFRISGIAQYPAPNATPKPHLQGGQ